MRSRARCVALIAVVAACRSTGTPSAVGGAAQPDPCLIPAREAVGHAPSIATEGAIDHTSLHRRPRSPADSVVFAHVYETLVRVTCDGRLVPGLAERWSDVGDTSGRTWTFYLRPDARFHDGTAVTVRDVLLALRNSETADRETALRALPVESLSGAVHPDRTVTVRLWDSQREGPRLFADPLFSIHRAGTDSVAIGTGAFAAPGRVDRTSETGVVLHRAGPAEADGIVRTLRILPSRDILDRIDQDVDIVRTRDRRAIDYAATRPGFRAQRLPADRAYLLLSPARRPTPTNSTPAFDPSRALDAYVAPNDPRWTPLRTAIARDVLRTSEPQTAEGSWVTEDPHARCFDYSAPRRPDWTSRTTGPRRLLFPMSDSVAAALAGRLVALAGGAPTAAPEAGVLRELLQELVPSAGIQLLAFGASETELASSLLVGADVAYLLPQPRRVVDPCAAWRIMARRAPWVAPGRIAFIVESAPTLITGPRAPAVAVDWTGMLRVVPRPTAASPPQ